ncbi:hypothetical protein Tco_0804104 [Tanacetum coccineum]|uniref:Uncharacterized protein n=1 Tax=Tanacetum coccineum TaxID=301880 RepID=A0ABQ5A5Z3_9ASTR
MLEDAYCPMISVPLLSALTVLPLVLSNHMLGLSFVVMGLYINTFSVLKDDIPDEECKPAPKKLATAVAKSGKKAIVSSEENT